MPPAQQSRVATGAGAGFEIGNLQQIDLLIAAVNRVADVIEAKKQAGIEAEMRRMAEDFDEMREEQRWRQPP